MMKKLMASLLVWLPMVTAGAQTDTITTSRLIDQFPIFQPLKVDMANILPEKQKRQAIFSPVFHTDWQQFFVPSVRNQVLESNAHYPMMVPYWMPMMFDDVRTQPVFNIKAGKNTFSFGIGVNMDAVRRGIDIQRMEQWQQQQMMDMRRR